MSRWDANSDRDYDDICVRFTRPCENPKCERTVPASSTSVFCFSCLAAAEDRVIAQRTRELHERRAS